MIDWNKFCESHYKILLLVCLVFFVLISSFHLSEQFVADEIDFVQAGRAVADTGRPVYYQGEMRPEFNGTWHPPLFVSLVGLSFYTAGVGEAQVRTLTMTFAALTIFLVFFLALELFSDRDNKYTIAIAACYIYAFNPLTIQSGLMIDIDTGILMFGMTAYLLLFLKLKDSINLFKLIILGLAFAALIWIKFGTPPIILIGIFLFYALNRELKKAVAYPVVIGAIGAAVFVCSWWLVASAKDLPFSMPFTHNSGTLSNMGFETNEPRYVAYVLGGRIKLILFWLTPFMMILAQQILRARWRRFRKHKRLENIDLLLIIALIIFVEYTLVISIAYYFPKYYIPMIPLLAILVAYLICQQSYFNKNNNKKKNSDETGKKIMTIYVISALIALILMFLFLGDPNLSRDQFGDSIVTGITYVGIFLAAGLFLKFFLKLYAGVNRSWTKAVFTTVVMGLAVTSVYINVIQINADYSVRYNYGETGMDEVVDYIKLSTNESSVIIAPKDVGYYSELKYYEAFGGWMEDLEILNDTIESRQISHIIIRKTGAYGLEELPKEILDFIRNNFNELNYDKFGDFVVFQRF